MVKLIDLFMVTACQDPARTLGVPLSLLPHLLPRMKVMG